MCMAVEDKLTQEDKDVLITLSQLNGSAQASDVANVVAELDTRQVHYRVDKLISYGLAEKRRKVTIGLTPSRSASQNLVSQLRTISTTVMKHSVKKSSSFGRKMTSSSKPSLNSERSTA